MKPQVGSSHLGSGAAVVAQIRLALCGTFLWSHGSGLVTLRGSEARKIFRCLDVWYLRIANNDFNGSKDVWYQIDIMISYIGTELFLITWCNLWPFFWVDKLRIQGNSSSHPFSPFDFQGKVFHPGNFEEDRRLSAAEMGRWGWFCWAWHGWNVSKTVKNDMLFLDNVRDIFYTKINATKKA